MINLQTYAEHKQAQTHIPYVQHHIFEERNFCLFADESPTAKTVQQESAINSKRSFPDVLYTIPVYSHIRVGPLFAILTGFTPSKSSSQKKSSIHMGKANLRKQRSSKIWQHTVYVSLENVTIFL